MSASAVTDVLATAMRLANRAGASEIDIDILLLALDFEAGPAMPPDLSEIDALLARYGGTGEGVSQFSGESGGWYWNSEWIGLSAEAQAAIAPFGSFDTMTTEALRQRLLAAKKNHDPQP
jgi:hypothetical protein